MLKLPPSSARTVTSERHLTNFSIDEKMEAPYILLPIMFFSKLKKNCFYCIKAIAFNFVLFSPLFYFIYLIDTDIIVYFRILNNIVFC